MFYIIENVFLCQSQKHTHLNLFINLWHTFLRIDVEDERSQGLNIAIIDWPPVIFEVGGEELQDPG